MPERNPSILFVIDTTEYGGAEKHLIELVSSFRGSPFEPSILCYGPDFYSDRLNQSGNSRIIVKCKQQPTSFLGWVRDFRDAQPDVVVFVYGGLWSFRWYVTIAACMAGVRRRFSIHTLFSDPQVPARLRGRPIRNALRKLLGRRTPRLLALRISPLLCRMTICVSDAVRESLIRNYGFPARKMTTVHNGANVVEFVLCERNRVAVRARLGLSAEDFVLVCTARLSKIKGIDILLSAMAKVVHGGTSCRCIIVGDGPLREDLSRQMRDLDLRGHVFFEGFQEDVRPYLQAASAFVLTSHREGLPLSIVEAMACGLPCVVTNVGGNAEAVTHKLHGFVVSPGSVAEVADAISYLAKHPEERAQMSGRARLRACTEFNMEDRIAEIKRIIFS